MDGRWGWSLVVLGALGCIGAPETRFLSCMPRPPEVERRSYDYHDPFADEKAGPATQSRPRAFQEPRSDTRKTFDLRFLQALHPTGGNPVVVRGPVVPGGAAPTIITGTATPWSPSAAAPVANNLWTGSTQPPIVPAY